MSSFGQEEACSTDCQCHDCWGVLQNKCHPCICCIGVPHDEISDYEYDTGSCGYYKKNECCPDKDKLMKKK